jgi:UrcA family protein
MRSPFVHITKFERTAEQLVRVVAVGCLIFAGNVSAKDHNVTVALRVSAAGLDLSQPADAQTFYTRLRKAAWIVCTHGDRVDLEPADDEKGCIEKALADAVRSVKAPMLTQVYLANHTIQGAATGWSYVPVPEGAK